MEEAGWWSEQHHEEIQSSIRDKKALLSLTGVWKECRGETGGMREIRERVQRHGMRTRALMKQQHGQGMYFLHCDVRNRTGRDPDWMKEGRDAGDLTE
eukprot:2811193-Alexandrium_andersonii.AAC.1